ncbi:MAG TPA: hypothetical protein VEJ84_15040 [Acidimicrobiales bacterium]|nr:hypothetical protein [Acidimicrobiales bacterium]
MQVLRDEDRRAEPDQTADYLPGGGKTARCISDGLMGTGAIRRAQGARPAPLRAP